MVYVKRFEVSESSGEVLNVMWLQLDWDRLGQGVLGWGGIGKANTAANCFALTGKKSWRNDLSRTKWNADVAVSQPDPEVGSRHLHPRLPCLDAKVLRLGPSNGWTPNTP